MVVTPARRRALQRVVMDLVVNRIQALPRGGTLLVTAGVRQAERPPVFVPLPAGRPAT
jgi:hypothetical protein